ncbi:MAG: hypothetical protein HY782_24840 [Chloroflexi bacterium]|nr:hypothetical protein [Chloroflexota bacterium]
MNRKSLLLFLAGPAFMGALSLLAWVMLGGGVLRPPQRIEFVIPDGAAERVQAGQAIPSIPAKAVFVVGDVLALRNDDRVNHQMGPFWMPARTTLTIPLDRESTFNYLCTIHPSGYIGLQVRPQNSLLLALIPTFGFGVPISALLLFIARIMAKLG